MLVTSLVDIARRKKYSLPTCNKHVLREVVKATTFEQDPPNHKVVGGVRLPPPCLTSKDGVFVA